MTYTYQLSNNTSNSAVATFNVTGPTQVTPATLFIKPTVGTVEIQPMTGNKITQGGTPTLVLLGLPVGNAQTGITLAASANLPPSNPGSYSWVQLLNGDLQTILRMKNGATVLSSCTTFATGPVLDGGYPYSSTTNTNGVQNDTLTDNPEASLFTTYGFLARQFSATAYLMWNPGLPNSIPVPLASIGWKFTGNAIAKGVVGTNWAVGGCGLTSGGTCQAAVPSSDPKNFAYPVWTAVAPLNAQPNCTP